MFDTPLFVTHEFVLDTARAKARLKFSREEQKAIAQNPGDKPDVVYRRIRITHLKGKQRQFVEYVGLASSVTYDEKGNVLDATKKTREDLNLDFRRIRGNSAARHYDITKTGREPLLRTTIVPRVIKESPKVEEILATKKLSANAERILKRTNYIRPYYLQQPENPDDDWLRKGLRLRSVQILANVLQLAILRRDYVTAGKVYPVLIRIHFVDPRALWTLGVEILQQQGLDGGKDQLLYDWLLTAYPSIRVKRPKWKVFQRALQMFPYYMLSLLAQGYAKEAKDQMEDALTDAPYSDDPTCFAVFGLVLMDLGMMDYARRQFATCKKLGGDVAGVLTKFLAEEIDLAMPSIEEEEPSSDDEPADTNNVSEDESDASTVAAFDSEAETETEDQPEQEPEQEPQQEPEQDEEDPDQDQNEEPNRKRKRAP